MEAIAWEKEQGKERLLYRCVTCGKLGKNKVQDNDDFEAVLALARKRVTEL